MQIAIYGKGGIGKSTIAANISAALAAGGSRVMQIGCDPKHDSTRLLLRGVTPPTVLDYIRDTPPDRYQAADIILSGEFGVDCAEAGGPEPGIGCAGRGILTTFEMLDSLHIRDSGYDYILYDVLGDVVCGGFAVPIRNEYSDKVFIITSGEFMSLYAANNILRGLKNYETGQPRVGGIIFNARGGDYEQERVRRFAEAVGLPIVMSIPRDDAFAASERAFRCLVAQYPDSELAAGFRGLAATVADCPLFQARPLSDEELERQVLADEGGDGEGQSHGGLRQSADGAAEPGVQPPQGEAAGGTAPEIQPPSQPEAQPDANLEARPDAKHETQPETRPALLSRALVNKEPLHGCAFNGALSITTQLADCVTIAHGPRSCAHIAFQALTSISRRMLLERSIVLPMQTAPPVISTDMSESVMIFGGADVLRQRILEAQASEPPAIFVISTCPSGIIGEDLAAVAGLSTDKTKVIPIAADGNLAGDHLQGVFLGYEAIAEHLIDRDARPEPGLVNIIGEKTIAQATSGNLEFISDVLERLGMRVNCRFLCESDYGQVHGFMKAPLNLLAYADDMGVSLRGYLEESFGARFFEKPFPVGFAESRDWVREIAQLQGMEDAAQAVIDDFQIRYDRLVAGLKPRLAGKRLMVVTFNHNIDWILSTALDVGMEIGFVGVLDYSQDHSFRTAYADQIAELHPSLDYSALMRSDDVGRIKPDVLLGNYLPSEGMGVPVCDTMPLCPDAGFLSGINMAARWAELLRADLGEGWRRDADLYRKHGA
ncbi:MAG: nitrogen fixation protein NifEH [Coriobacteriia bacterium]|nr:nitrogen fixation protein NifEH [Coriobacteriia bacterium]